MVRLLMNKSNKSSRLCPSCLVSTKPISVIFREKVLCNKNKHNHNHNNKYNRHHHRHRNNQCIARLSLKTRPILVHISLTSERVMVPWMPLRL